ncbi:hypothetical protein EIP86_007241 [Pleurotus ostreatoroseus]|nr:hypothetical protein EIP86_007241 [Pleurotus ostreatoroseus]
MLGRHALQLQADPSNAERQFLRINVRQRPAVRREHTFYATDASVVSFSDIHPSEAADMQLNREQLDIRNRAIGMTGTFLVLLVCEDPRGGTVAPFGFRVDDLPPYDEGWKDLLIKLLNEGIIILYAHPTGPREF